MRKGFAITLGAFVLGTITLYGVFISLPSPQYEDVIKVAREEGKTAFAASQVDANDAQKNGWLNPTFLPYWGRKDKEGDPSAKIGKVVENWVEYSTSHIDKAVDHQKLIADKDAKFQSALAEFEKAAPELEKAFNAPRFVAPETNFTYETVVMNFLALRIASQGVLGLAELRLAQNQPTEAMRLLLGPVNVAKNLRSQGPIISDAVGASISSLALDTMAVLIDPKNANVPASAWKEAAAKLTAAVPPKDLLLIAAKMETTAANATFELPPEDQRSYPTLAPFSKAPGMLAREQRIYNNLMGDLLQDLQENRSPVIEGVNEENTLDFLTGKIGMISLELVPTSLARMQSYLDQNRRQLIATAAMSGVAAYLGEKKSLPQDLEQVRTVATIPDTAVLAEAGVSYQLTGASATLTAANTDATIELSSLSNYDPHPWFQRDKAHMTWTF